MDIKITTYLGATMEERICTVQQLAKESQKLALGLQLSGRALDVQGPGFDSLVQHNGNKTPRNYL